MVTISYQQADQLSKLMAQTHAIKATTEKVIICGVEATVVVLDHVDREDTTWQSVHVLSYISGGGVANLGNIPKVP
jgi:2-methylcitrate dehydratase PrpD